MRVLIADKFEQSGRDRLAAIGCEVLYQPGTKDEALVQAIAQSAPDVLVVRSTKVTETMLAAGALKLVVRAGAGYNTIDVAAASRRGIYVSNCPGKNSIAVAELAFGADPGARPAPGRQRGQPAPGRVEQGAISRRPAGCSAARWA